MERYRHVQVGWLMIVVGVILIVCGGLFVTSSMRGADAPTLVCCGAGALMVLLFGSLTVVVHEGEVRIRFGIGLIRKRYSLSQFVKVQAVRNKWYYGWGIRWWPGCVIYNVSGLDAVELKRADDTVVRIGTDEPEKLREALAERMK